MHKTIAIFLFFSSSLIAGAADLNEVDTFVDPKMKADSGIGSQYRRQAYQISNLMKAGKYELAYSNVDNLIEKYKKLIKPNTVYYSFYFKDEYNEFKSISNEEFIWIDWSYISCLQYKAFMLVQQKSFDDALELLSQIETLAPISANAKTEKGYILRRLGKMPEALAAYNNAYSLVKKYKSQKPLEGMVLRGIGSILIDMKKLDEAEEYFVNSLLVEPNNSTALHELKYIKHLKSAR